MYDCWGVSMGVGDHVLYPGRSGSTVWLTKAVILEIGERHLLVQPYDSTSYSYAKKPVKITALRRVTRL